MPTTQPKNQPIEQKIICENAPKAVISFLSSAVLCVVMLGTSSAFAQTDNPFKGSSSNTQQSRMVEAFDAWMLRAYEGDRDAQFKVALMFSDGTGTNKDIEQAVYWYIQAARQGLASAQYNLGHKYLNGDGTIKDPAKAVNWWRKAAEQDHELAQFNVARAYYSGIGVNQDEERAKYWFQRAASNDEPRSRKILADVFGQSNEQIGAIVTTTEPTGNIGGSQGLDGIGSSVSTTNHEIAAAIEIVDNPTDNSIESATEIVSITEPAIVTESTTQQEQAIVASTLESSSEAIIDSIVVYNKPRSDSAVISQESYQSLQVVQRTKNWAKIRSTQGLPVWVFNKFVKLNDDGTATITGDNVNARATPLILRGSVVGQFFKGEELPILESQGDWVRVQSPAKFTAWVKRLDLAKARGSNKSFIVADATPPLETTTIPTTTPITANIATPITTQPDVIARPTATIKTTDSYAFKNSTNDNAWLFSQPGDMYTLQLASFSDDAILENFIEKNKLSNDSNARQFISNRNNIEWKYILYGAFSSLKEANAVKSQKKFNKAWVRKIGKIRKNRCVAWKTTLPTPPELKAYCQ